MIHLRINTLPALHVIGVYLDCKPTVEQANSVQARLEAKLQEITGKDEDVLLMGDLNRPMDKPTELQKTRIMKDWIDTGKVILLNDPRCTQGLTQRPSEDPHWTWATSTRA